MPNRNWNDNLTGIDPTRVIKMCLIDGAYSFINQLNVKVRLHGIVVHI